MGQTFIMRNEGFDCEMCGQANEPAPQTCRNHCRYCLHSKHVDVYPGDRANTCLGVLKPVGVEFQSGEMKNIQFLCTKCSRKSRNKIAPDDDRDALIALMRNNKP